MTQTLWIPGKLPGLNDLLAAAKSGRGNRNAYSRIKAQWSDTVWVLAKSARLQRCERPVTLAFEWIETNRRRDPDNLCGGGKKLILDGLVKAGVLENDSARFVYGWTDTWLFRKTGPGVTVEITEVEPTA